MPGVLCFIWLYFKGVYNLFCSVKPQERRQQIGICGLNPSFSEDCSRNIQHRTAAAWSCVRIMPFSSLLTGI